MGNRDDHLRNHGFLLTRDGWRLAPAFDVNPNIDKGEHVLDLDHGDNRPSLDTVLSTAEWYGLDAVEAEQIVETVSRVVGRWRDMAREMRLSEAELAYMEGAFAIGRYGVHAMCQRSPSSGPKTP